MPPYILIEKREGQTPLQALDELRIARPELAEVSLTYAGRLDPMASGKLLVLNVPALIVIELAVNESCCVQGPVPLKYRL